ncbi:MAG: hypothetical protein M1833_004486 [Piccolia ochrophora]|nr:MAG: hypothetical protein M1833_004486 [Piccolia ochrophora]
MKSLGAGAATSLSALLLLARAVSAHPPPPSHLLPRDAPQLVNDTYLADPFHDGSDHTKEICLGPAANISPDYAFHAALARNKLWRSQVESTNPTLLPSLAAGQKPQLLWIGCSDSRVPETTILGVQPGDVFVHRNIANNVLHGAADASSAAVLAYAVGALGVQHVVLAGHTNCGGAAAALAGKPLGEPLDAWLRPIADVVREKRAELDAVPDQGEKTKRLAVWNVEKGVKVLLANEVVQDAIIGRGLQVHGVLYDVGKGTLEELDFGNGEADKAHGKA